MWKIRRISRKYRKDNFENYINTLLVPQNFIKDTIILTTTI